MQLKTACSLLVSGAFVVAGAAMAQSPEKERLATPKQNNAKPSATKSTATPKSLDFAPATNVKELVTREAAPTSSQAGQAPTKQGSHCHSKESDA